MTELAGAIDRRSSCSGYDARVSDDAPRSHTAYYIVGGKLWGFGLLQPRANPCR